jgi:hypothetical protein
MHKNISFAITAAVLLTAIVTLYTFNGAHAVIAKSPLVMHPRSFIPSAVTGHPTAAHAMPMSSATAGNAAKNMTNATASAMGAAKNATGK